MHEFRSFTMPLRGSGLGEDWYTLGTLLGNHGSVFNYC